MSYKYILKLDEHQLINTKPRIRDLLKAEAVKDTHDRGEKRPNFCENDKKLVLKLYVTAPK